MGQYAPYITIGITVLVQVISLTIVLTRMSVKIDLQGKEIQDFRRDYGHLPNEVIRLQTILGIQDKEINTLREHYHTISNTLNALQLTLAEVKTKVEQLVEKE